jgi:two-component system phosphate regulon sensor histidine kinase PhoR
MGHKKLIWQLYGAFLLMIAIPALLFTWYSTTTFKKFFIKSTINELTERAYQIGSQMEGVIGQRSSTVVDSLCKIIGRNITMRFTVIAQNGTVLGDSEKNPAEMENHKNRTEVLTAMSGKIGVIERFSNTLNERMIYVAIPIHQEQIQIGVVRTAISVAIIHLELNNMYLRFSLGYLLLALFAALVSYFVSQRISRPVEAMKQGALRFASGDFSVKIMPAGTLEIDQLVQVLNEMGGRLRETIDSLTEQRNRIDAVLSSMVEGVIALDSNEHIIAINDAAVRLFGMEQKPETGTWIGGVLRNASISNFMKRVEQSGTAIEEEITLIVIISKGESSQRNLQLHGNVLRNADGNAIGVLTVINDITHIKHLETMRSDFVANVSHELRTPLTSVKGFVETLLAGAIDSKEETVRFLTIISRQVERLSKITEDLLTLSHVEQEAQTQGPELQQVKLYKLLTSIQETCGTRAAAKQIDFEIHCDRSLEVLLDPALIEEALINLVDNAINYSPENAHVILSGLLDSDRNELCLAVEDNGCGIAPEHHIRIFERFYRVDKARSRKLGGSGLGLSIVKHIALVHNGRVAVKSAPGKGSTFYIYIPLLNSVQEENKHG